MSIFYNDIMFDCETMSTRPNALVWQIAGVPFNAATGEISSWLPLVDLNVFIDWTQSNTGAYHTDENTIHWWKTQSNYQRMLDRLNQYGIPPAEAATKLVNWVRFVASRGAEPSAPVRVWSYGANADISWLEYLLAQHNYPTPWSYRNVRCLRTLCALYPDVEVVRPVEAHDAASDAVAQAQTVIKIFKEKGLTNV